MSARLEHGDVRVGVDADLAGDGETLPDDGGGGQIGVGRKGARGGESVGPPRADREDPIIRLDELARAGDDEAVLRVGDGEQGLESAKNTIAAPVLGELHRRAREVAWISLQLLLELLEQGERIGRGTGEAGEQLPIAERANLVGLRLHDGLAHGDLPIPAERNRPSAAYGGNRRGAAACAFCHGGKLAGEAVSW